MKIQKTELQKALTAVKPGLATKELIEQSTSFAFVDGKVVTYNDELSISYPLKEMEITGAVQAEQLYKLLSKLKGDELNMEIVDSELLIKCGKQKAGMTIKEEINLPIEEIGEISKWKKLPADFLKHISMASNSCSTDMMKPVLTCIHLTDTEIIGTDGFQVIRIASESIGIEDTLLPANMVSHIVSAKPIQISKGEGWVHFRTKEKAVLSCRIFEDKYPDVSKFFEVEGEKVVFPEVVKSIIDKAGIFSKADTAIDEMITIAIDSKKMTITGKGESGWYEESCKVDYAGEETSFNVTPYLLTNILSIIQECVLSEQRVLFQNKEISYLAMLRV